MNIQIPGFLIRCPLSFKNGCVYDADGEKIPTQYLVTAINSLTPEPTDVERLDADIAAEREPARCTTDHQPFDPTLKENGQQNNYVVLCEDERAKGFVRPVRHTYRHLKCGSTTTIGQALAETYARDPKFYGATFCCVCGGHSLVDEFVWLDGEPLGS